MRERIIAGNWKMHTTISEGCDLAAGIVRASVAFNSTKIVICPPTTHLQAVGAVVRGTPVELGAQNVHWATSGPFTGEISAETLVQLGCRWVIVGHSERRRLFGETDVTVNRRARHALEAGLRPIVCIGETLEEREQGITYSVLKRQIDVGLNDLPINEVGGPVIAYEPVWAIGTGRNATPEQAQEAHHFIRGELTGCFGSAFNGMPILYGGSVNEANAPDLLAQDDVDGALVGGASLKAEAFISIIRSAAG